MNHDPHQGQPYTSSAEPPDYAKPVAYDQNGNPLYAHPPAGYQQPGPQVVHITRPINPVDQPISPEAIRRWEASKSKHPNLNLTRGEYIISAVKRHPVGLVQIWFVVLLLILVFGAMFSMLFLGDANNVLSSIGGTEETRTGATLLLMVLFFLFVLGGMAATYIYQNNRFYLTNESVIQEIQTTLFSKHEQTVSLSNIEDASYRQSGILPMLLNYGTIRLSTEGDETTYRFSYVANPKRHIAVLNNAVEAFKNGRPVEGPNNDQPS